MKATRGPHTCRFPGCDMVSLQHEPRKVINWAAEVNSVNSVGNCEDDRHVVESQNIQTTYRVHVSA